MTENRTIDQAIEPRVWDLENPDITATEYLTGLLTGRWTSDGTYAPCPDCGWTPPHTGPGVPVHMPGTTHLRTCPRVPDLTPSPELVAALREIAECRRRAEDEARNVVISALYPEAGK